MPAGKIELTADQQASVVDAIRVLDNLSLIMDDLEACGRDCQTRRQEVQTTRNRLQNVLTRFSPK